MTRIILRADGNSQIGLGHVYRLLALAEMLNEDFECVFAINNPDEFILKEIEKSCSSYISLKNMIRYQVPDPLTTGDEIDFDMAEHLSGNEIVVTDGYLFGEKYQLAVKSRGAKLVCVDDLALHNFFADVVINHAPGIDHSIYKIQPGAVLLTGLNYALVRKPFFRPFIQKNDLQKNAFISLGGTDYFQHTKKIVKILLQDASFNSLQVLTSSSFSNPLLKDLNDFKSSSSKVSLHHNLTAEELINVMDSCTHAFVAASTVLFETYSRGLKCFTGYYVANQKFVYNGFTNQRLALGLGSFDELNEEIFSEKIKNQDSINYLTLPLSSTEILKTFYLLCKNSQEAKDFNYKLREVIASDIDLLFEWANDDEVRKSAINTHAISIEEHVVWFNKKINSTACKSFILEIDNQAAGQSRFEFDDIEKIWKISYSISKKFRGLGLGKLLLKESISALNEFPLVAYVKEENARSQNVFNALGFKNMGVCNIQDTKLLKYTKSSNV